MHYHQGEEALAQEVVRAAERAHDLLVPALGHAPRDRTEVVLSDDTDQANGSATPLPYDTIRLYAVPPTELSELNAYRDWVPALVFHEYVHVLHLGEVGGIPGLANRLFGRLLFPNGLVPGWMVEGMAVLHEGDGEPPGAGRNRSALFDMYARALATEPPGFPALDAVSSPMVEWPSGSVPYLLGGRFMAFLEARYGRAALAGYLRDQGSQLWPYAPGWVAERWFGKDFLALWADYRASEEARFAAQLVRVRGRPVTRPRRLTAHGGEATTPRWSPDGAFIAYYRRTLDRRPGVFRITPDGRDLGRAATIDANGALALRSPREAVVAITEVWREHRLYDDLWLVDLETGGRRRLTDGARATEPALTPDGAAVVYVRREDGGGLRLVRRPLAGGPEELLVSRPGAQLFAPAPSPDGRRVAFVLQEDGHRDLALWEDGKVTRITDDDALDASPAWTPDGRFVLFSSDRGGIYDLYAWEAATGAIRQVTNVESGAFQPAVSPDGKTIAFLTYSRAGFDLATIPFDPETWLEPEPAPPPVALPAAAAPAPLPSRPYSPWATLTPRWWFPIWGADGAGSTFGAVTGGSDVLGRHAYALQAWWSAIGREPGYSAAYLGGWSWPRLDLSSSRWVDTAPGGTRGLQTDTSFGAGATFTFSRLTSGLSLRLGWDGTRYDVMGERRRATTSDGLGWGDGFLAELSLRVGYSDARRFARSISPEEGRTVALAFGAAGPEIGSDFQLARARGAYAGYLRVPGTEHAVIAARLGGGVAHGSIGGRAPYKLGGATTADPLSLLLGTVAAPTDQLRGYPYGWLLGTGFDAASLELRFPIASPGWGHSTWPLFLRRLHGAAFADLGDAFDLPGELPFAGHGFSWQELRLGAGAELRAEVVLGYWLPADVHLGLAHAFGRVFRGESREAGVDPLTVYLTVGPAF
ncbi:BamA/TamA family outer membrane protein [Anaeromyxobacter oryzisoli]|uniref:BamA/TamA family outer membrane protein n=1 Tax=Anaeromyxobacter oryzisoli TaxID=2925408 RepID=UPI001F59E0D6|nr:BamA/TamA family outer membrane protein [Anaeromyxobacter sp. SG63]